MSVKKMSKKTNGVRQEINIENGKFEKKNKCRECLENLHELPC